MKPSRPLLFFATIAAGGGHVATAKAMLQAVEATFPNRFAMSIGDYMNELGDLDPDIAEFDRRHKEMWKSALRRPWIARFGQRVIDAFPRVVVRIERAVMKDVARAMALDLAARDVSLVVSNHGLLTAALSLAKRRYGLKLPVLTFATEAHGISAYWADAWADHILVPNVGVKRTLARMGVPNEKLEVVGYPVQQAFLRSATKSEAREGLGLADRFTVLVSLGGEGIGGNVSALVRAISSAGPGWQIVVICGRNADLRRQLESTSLANVRVEGFADDMAAFLTGCDVVVGKAGPASVFEALAVGRPVLVTSYAGLNELGAVRMLEREGLGGFLPIPERLLARLRRFEERPEDLSEVERRARSLDLSGQTERLARRIVDYAEMVA